MIQIRSRPTLILILCLIDAISIIIIVPNVVLSQKKSSSKIWPSSSSQWAQHYHPLFYSSPPEHASRYKNGLHNTARRHQPAYYNPEYLNYLSSSKTTDAYTTDPNQYSDYPEQAYGLSERYDYEDDDYKKHTKVEHHEHEMKEMSFVYPVLLALLILGALFIPFISLFFFLAVSAFNCNSGLGSNGFGQVTPFMGKRRRRRRSISSEASLLSAAAAAAASTTSIDDNNNIPQHLAGNRTHSSKMETRDVGSIAVHLPRLMLFDASEQQSDETGGSQLILDYEFLRKQLARNTVRLRDALMEIGAWLDQDDAGQH